MTRWNNERGLKENGECTNNIMWISLVSPNMIHCIWILEEFLMESIYDQKCHEFVPDCFNVISLSLNYSLYSWDIKKIYIFSLYVLYINATSVPRRISL